MSLPAVAPQIVPVDLTGRQKVAVLCMALGPEFAAKIAQQLNPEEMEAISFEIARMDKVDQETAEAVLHEWIETSRAAGSIAVGGEQLLGRTPQMPENLRPLDEGTMVEFARQADDLEPGVACVIELGYFLGLRVQEAVMAGPDLARWDDLLRHFQWLIP